MNIRDGVDTYALDFPYNWEGVENALCVHVIETTDHTVLFGSGHETTTDQILEVAVPDAVDTVFVEHGDADHYGGVPALRSELDIDVAVPSGDADWIRDAGITPDHELVGGEVFRGVEAIDAPGHTPGNMAFLFDDILIAGDTLVHSTFPAVSDDGWTGRLAISSPSRNTGGDELAQQSVKDLLDYDFDVVLLTHGANVLEGGKEAVRTLVKDLEADVVRHDG